VECSVSGGIGTASLDGGPALCGASGSIDIDDGSLAISTFIGSASLPAGSEVSVTASPGTGYELAALSGCDGDVADPCVVTVNGNRSLTANFSVVSGNFDLTLSGGPAAGTILGYTTAPRAEPLGEPDFSCTVGPHTIPCMTPLEAGMTVRLIAQPDAGSTFDGWALDCALASGTDCWLQMLEPHSADASFAAVAPTEFLLSVVIDSGIGAVTSDPTGINCSTVPGTEFLLCEYSFAEGTVVDLSSFPATGSGFTYGLWYVDDTLGDVAYCARESCQVTMDQDHDVTANFEVETAS